MKMELEKIEPNNFIEDIVVKDIKEKHLKKIVTRFPPEPNGFLHIGHPKAISIDFLTAKKFGGYTNLRMDDTNPEKESYDYVNSIVDDIKWLGFSWKHLKYASDYYGKLYKIAIKFIKKGLAYVCDLSAEEISKYRGNFTTPGTESPYRNRSIEENLKLFKEMKAGKYADGSKTLRAKIDMTSPNLNMRDPIMYRICRSTHFRQGNKWCIYPIYDFAHPISDAIEGITHSLCSMEFEDHRPLYDWFVTNAGFKGAKKPRQIEFARLNVEGAILSKRYINQMVNNNLVDGYDDPRLLTVKGMRRRGYSPESILDFVARVGVSKADSTVEYQYLEHCVREDLNKHATRIMAVLEPIKVIITNYPIGRVEQIEIENNPNNKSAGTHLIKFEREIYIEQSDFMENPPAKYYRLTPNGCVRLKGAYIIKCDKVVKDKKGNVKCLECSYIENSKSGNDQSGIKVKGTIQWVNANEHVSANIHNLGPILKEGKSFNGDNLLQIFNKDSLSVNENAKIENYVLKVPAHKQMQFIRNGYYIKDEKLSTKEKPVYINTVGLKDSFNVTLGKK